MNLPQENLPRELQRKLQTVSNLPSPSRVAMAIMDLARDPDLNLTAVAGLINKDPALTTKILKTANSALFAQRRKSDNLRKALIVLGLDATLTLALSFTLVNSFRSQTVDGIALPDFWRNCLLSATAARVVGETLGRTDTEDLFLAGLLQDIGILALDKCSPGFYKDLDAERFDHDGLADYETARAGVDHAAIGAWLMRHWNMPERLAEAVESSHQTDAGHDDGFFACVAISGAVSSLFLHAQQDPTAVTALADRFEATTGMPAQHLGDVLTKVQEQIPDIEALYESDLIDASQAETILDQAREILMLRNLQALRSAESRNQELEEANRRDALTGVFNRGHMMKLLDQEFAAAAANSWPLSVAFVDLDKFKHINDTYGHLAGDCVLKGLAATLVASLRESDIVTRYGGDEFVIIMAGTDREMADAACRRITGTLAKTEHHIGDGRHMAVTISMGVASLEHDCRFATVDEFLAAADAAVYAVKQNGRNGYMAYAELSDRDNAAAAPLRDYRSAPPPPPPPTRE